MADRLDYGIMMFPRRAAETRRVAERAEALGFSWLGIADSPTIYQESFLHQLEALHATRRLTVGPVVTHVTLRHPLVVGNLLATLSEIGGGRTVGVLATGNSGARGVGLAPATVQQLGEAVGAIRGYWAGAGAKFGESRIPATGLARRGCPLFIAADGQRVATLAGEQGDGMFYGGTMEPAVLARRIAAGRKRADQKLWLGPAVSLARTVGSVLEEMGTLVVAMANRAFRGDLFERGIPEALHADVRAMWQRYDYAYHADATRPLNLGIVSSALAEFLVEHFVIWGDAPRWRSKFDLLRSHGCNGVMFILGQGDADQTTEAIASRLRELGEISRASS
jgi:5,10-methylenetetrahydromethanopterin reductase